MKETIHRTNPEAEFETTERCAILELWNDVSDGDVSVARATVKPGIATQPHRLHGVIERYVILSGRGEVTIGELAPTIVEPNDVVIIPAGVSQSIANIGPDDLVFLCVCSPRFTPECYESLG